jgi:hypothetical protein
VLPNDRGADDLDMIRGGMMSGVVGDTSDDGTANSPDRSLPFR